MDVCDGGVCVWVCVHVLDPPCISHSNKNICEKCVVQILTPPRHPLLFLLIESIQTNFCAVRLLKNDIYSPHHFI